MLVGDIQREFLRRVDAENLSQLFRSHELCLRVGLFEVHELPVLVPRRLAHANRPGALPLLLPGAFFPIGLAVARTLIVLFDERGLGLIGMDDLLLIHEFAASRAEIALDRLEHVGHVQAHARCELLRLRVRLVLDVEVHGLPFARDDGANGTRRALVMSGGFCCPGVKVLSRGRGLSLVGFPEFSSLLKSEMTTGQTNSLRCKRAWRPDPQPVETPVRS